MTYPSAKRLIDLTWVNFASKNRSRFVANLRRSRHESIKILLASLSSLIYNVIREL